MSIPLGGTHVYDYLLFCTFPSVMLPSLGTFLTVINCLHSISNDSFPVTVNYLFDLVMLLMSDGNALLLEDYCTRNVPRLIIIGHRSGIYFGPRP